MKQWRYVLTESEFQELAGMLQCKDCGWSGYARRAPFDAVSCYLDRQYGIGGWQNATLRLRRTGSAAAMDYAHFYFYGEDC